MKPAAQEPSADPMPEPMVITPTMTPRFGPGKRSAVFAVTAGPRAPRMRPKNDAWEYAREASARLHRKSSRNATRKTA